MSSTIESIAQRLREELEGVIDGLVQVDGEQPSLHEIEEQLWREMVKLGRGLLQMRLDACSEAEVVRNSVAINAVSYSYERASQRGYVSLFGEV